MSERSLSANLARTTAAPRLLTTPARFLQRKCACGKHATGGECEGCKKRGILQRATLSSALSPARGRILPRSMETSSWGPYAIGQVNDSFEREADEAARQVVAPAGPRSGERPSITPTGNVLQRHTSDLADGGANPALIDSTLRSAGQPLDPETRRFVEPRFGRDFSNVRLHHGGQAAESASSIGAAAYAVGNHIVFGSGYYSPGTSHGMAVLAHELTHVIQQGHSNPAAPNGPAHEREAQDASRSIVNRDATIQIGQSAMVGLAAMSVAEARQSLWGHVPDSVKEYVRPIAREAAKQMDRVVPPNTELPKAVEAVVHPVEAISAVVDESKKAVSQGLQAVDAASSSVTQTAAKVKKVVKEKAKEKVRDYATGALGSVKGVALEVTGAVDTLVWVTYAEHDLVQEMVGKGATGDVIMAAADTLSGYAALHAIAKMGLSDVDPVTGKPNEQFSSTLALGGVFDSVEGKLEGQFAGLPPEQALVFTSYESGELGGSIGSQAALAFVGVEEVQLALKTLGAIGAAKQMIEAIQHDRQGWYKSPAFWTGALNVVLSILNLKGKVASKIAKMVIASGGLLNVIPAVWQMYNDYTDPKLADSPARDKKLKDDFSNIVKLLAAEVIQIIHRGGAGNAPGKPVPSPEHTATTSPEHASTPHAPNVEQLPGVVSAESLPAPRSEVQTGGTSQHPATTAAAPQKPAPSLVPAREEPVQPRKSSAGKPAAEEQGAKKAASKPEETASSINKEEALAHEPTEDGHEAVAAEGGVGVCSPSPCPVITVKYAGELKEFPSLKEWNKKIQAMRKTNPRKAVKEAAALVRTLEAARANAAKAGGRKSAGGSFEFELDVSQSRAEKIKSGKKNFVLDRALTFDIDEVLPVGAGDINRRQALARARDPYNRQLLDPHTNQDTKGLGIDPRELRRNRGEQQAVSLKDDPSAMLTKRFSEVREMKSIFERAVASVESERGVKPTELKERINKEVRRIITQDNSPDAKAVRRALKKLGFSREPGLGFAMQKGDPAL
jgi:hypothetical protein